MLKRIEPSDVVLGMYIHKLEGNWFTHPFWSARFLLTDPERLEQLHASQVPGVIIDTELGLDPDAPPPSRVRRADAPRAPQPARAPAPIPAPPPPPIRAATPAPVESPPGFGKAQGVAQRGLKVVTKVFLEMRLGKAIAAAAVSPVIDSIIESVQTNPFAFNGLMRFRRDSEDIYRHALATSALMIALARTMRLPPDDVRAAGLAGLLLDSGFARLPEDAGNLRDLPTEVWRSHVPLGHAFILRSKLSDNIARACLEHHERFDGTGWPHGTGGNGLSTLGRMAAICDAYDLLATGGDGKPALDAGEALRAMQADQGRFDPGLLTLFAAAVGSWPTGSVVELASGRLAVVVGQNPHAPDRPLVSAFFAPATGKPVSGGLIDLAAHPDKDSVVGPGVIADLPPALHSIASAALAAAVDRAFPETRRAPGTRAA